MLQKIRELSAVRDCFSGPHAREAGMFMKTNRIVELTCNVIENKRVVRSRCEEVDSRLRGNDRDNVTENKRVVRDPWT